MLTEILIKPFIKDLERQGIKDTTPYEQGFMAGMAALSSILSENIDNKAQLFVYLGMAISEGVQWVEEMQSERDILAPIFKDHPKKQSVPGVEKSGEDWDYMPSHDDLEASFIQKYAKQKVVVRFDWSSPCIEGQTVYDLSGNRLQVIDMSGNQIKRPYYIKLR